MPKIPLDTHTIRYKGLFDFDGLYNLIVQWMKARRFWFHETKYKHKVPLPTGAEQEISFKGDKDVTEYIKYYISVDFHIWDMTEVEMEREGKRKILTNARMEIKLSGALEVDPEGRFGKTRFLQGLRNFVNKYILKKDIDAVYADELRYRIYKLHDKIKEFLDMQAKGSEYKRSLGDN